MSYDLLIRNGTVVDGSGEPGFQADVAVQDGRIVGVGKYAGAAAKRTIEAEGRVVAPGFIDHHTHFDPQAVWDPYCGSWVHNGHTTVIVGQCGQVIAPVRPGDGEWYLEFFSDAEQIPLPVLKAGVDVTWESVGDYLNALGRKRGINVGTLVGHSGIRRYVMGEAASDRQATPEEMAAMQRLIRGAMHDGALGFSTAPKDRGDPAGVGDDAERWALASVLGDLGTGVFQVAGGAPGGTKETRRVARELAAMQRLVREAMIDGALGFSTAPKDRGDPAGHCDDDERWALASVLGELGTGVFQVAGGAPGGTKETRRVARELAARTGRPSIYNLVSDPIANPDEWVEHLKWLEDGFKSGARCYGSCLSTVAGAIFNLERGLNVPQDEDITNPEGFFRGMPTWDRVMALPYQDRMRAFHDPAIRQAMSAEAVEGTVSQAGGMTDRRGRARGLFNRRWDLVKVFMTAKGQNRHLEGRSIEEIATAQNKGIMDAFLDLSLDEDLQTCFIAIDRNNNPATQKHILGSQYTVIGTSDGGGRPHTADRHETSTHLLGHWVREQQAMTLEEAVYRLTGKTALMHDITDRGFIAAGKVADITIFDPATIGEKPREPVATLPAGGIEVKRDAVGIDYVVVNGQVLLDRGELTDALPGQIVRGPLYQAARA